MNRKEAHLRKARHNYAAMLCLDEGGEYPDCVATVIFYAALHVVEAVFAHDGKPGPESTAIQEQ
jgi:hypothetical protein